jgi:ribose-phosphate pyrophosphokinase
MFLVSTSSCSDLCDKLAKTMDYRKAEMERKRFPDGELYLRIKDHIKGNKVIVVANTRRDEDLVETILTSEAARGSDPSRLITLIPYFGYARQHKRYLEGEPISSKAVGMSFIQYFDMAAVVDIHDESAMEPFHGKLVNIHITDSIADYFSGKAIDFVISPDDGGMERASIIAKKLRAKTFYFEKKRIDPRTVEMEAPNIDIRGKNILIVDDIISTGGTIIKAVQKLREMSANRIYATAVHGLFVNGSGEKIKGMVEELAVTNTVHSDYSRIDISVEVSKHLREMMK